MPGELSRPRWMEKAVQRLFVKKQEGEGLVVTECVKVTSFFLVKNLHSSRKYLYLRMYKEFISSNPKTVYYE